MTTREITDALRARYAPPVYGFITEVGNAVGFKCNRHADALAMGIWPSRGLELEGFEVKAFRGDWLKELKAPAKAESIFGFCDRWWLVVGDSGIVADGELPPSWGLMVATPRGFKVAIAAPKLAAQPVTRHFLAAMFRRCTEQSADAVALAKARQEGVAFGEANAESFRKRDKNNLAKLEAKVHEFEVASGLSIQHGWQGAGKIGQAVRRVLDGDLPADKIREVLGWVRQVQQSGEELLREVEGVHSSQQVA